MADFPRQEDLRNRKVTAMPMEKKAHALKPIGKASSTASTNDFQMLLACIHKLEERDRLQTPGQRYSDRQQITQQPENLPIRDPPAPK